MYVRPRLRVRPRNGGILAFSPASLFTSGVQGAWYDPSDINSYMAGLGSELVTNGDFANGTTGWTASSAGGGTFTASGGVATQSNTGTDSAYISFATVIGATYQIFGTIKAGSTAAGGFMAIRKSDNASATTNVVNIVGGSILSTTEDITTTGYFVATATTTYVVVQGNGNHSVAVDNISVKQVTSIGNATMFQDSLGQTPVTAVEQPVGLMLDKSQGLVIGSELITNGDFASGTTGWTAVNSTLANVSNTCQITANGAGAARAEQTITTVPGRWYAASASAWKGTTSISVSLVVVGIVQSTTNTTTTPTTLTAYFQATGTSTTIWVGTTGVTTAGETAFCDNVTVKSVLGNHARAPNDLSRPVLRARYNQFTYSEQFNNVAWTPNAATVSTNNVSAPDGTQTADTLTANAGTAVLPRVADLNVTTVSGAVYTVSIYVRAGTYTFLQIYLNSQSTEWANFTLSGAGTASANGSSTATIIALSDNWYRVTMTYTAGSTDRRPFFMLAANASATRAQSWNPVGTESIAIWGADLRTGSSAGTYQRIAAATDYSTAGFLPYLALVTDDSLSTGSIDFTATDAMFACVGITKNSDAANSLVYELSADLNSNNGAVNLFAPIVSGGLNTYYAASKGTVSAAAGTGTGVYVAPITNVVSMVSDISTPSLALRVNGSQVATSTATQGTGNYGNYPLNIGRRNNATLPLNGNIYQLIVCGKALSASELASTEAFVNSKTGAY